MRKHYLIISNIVTSFIFLIGYIIIIYLDARAYQGYVEKNAAQLEQSTAENVSYEIDNTMNHMIDVAHTMSCNIFLKDWLSQESAENNEEDSSADLMRIQSYLDTYRNEYDYDTIFLVSTETGNYYTQDGMKKTITKDDDHDIWFYNFLRKNVDYDIEIDTNQANDLVSMFINYKIKDSNGKVIGIVGAANQLKPFHDKIHSCEERNQLSVFLINQGSALNSYKGNNELFVTESELYERFHCKDVISLNEENEMKAQWFRMDRKQVCLVSEYNQNLQWEIVILKNTDTITTVFYQRLILNLGIFVIVFLITVVLLNAVILWQDKRVVARENIDELTGIPNRKLFTSMAISKYKDKADHMVFMMDVDNFKNINDTMGHLFGNQILETVGAELKRMSIGKGIVGRWGGDEFVGILDMTSDEAVKILNNLRKSILKQTEQMDWATSISIGLVQLTAETLEKDILYADKALYNSKTNGKGTITLL